jgi:hypothetical protein
VRTAETGAALAAISPASRVASAAPGEHEPHPGAVGQDPDVHRQGHGDADPDGGTVDGRDDWLQRAVDPQHQHAAAIAVRLGGGGVLAVIESPGAAAQVGACAESAAGPSDDDRTDRVIAVGLVECLDEAVVHRVVQRVEPAWPVHCDGGHRVGHAVQHFLCHGAPDSCDGSPR